MRIFRTGCGERYRCHNNNGRDIVPDGCAYDTVLAQENLSACILRLASIALYICFEPRYMIRMIEEWRNSFQKSSLAHGRLA